MDVIYDREREMPDGTMLHVHRQMFNVAILKSSASSWRYNCLDEKW